MNAAALPCPAWCQGKHNPSNAMMSHQKHYRAGGSHSNSETGVTLYLADYGTDSPGLASYNGRLSLHVWARTREIPGQDRDFIIDLDPEGMRDARKLAALLGALGHEDLAAGIGELLGLIQPAGIPLGYEPAAAESCGE